MRLAPVDGVGRRPDLRAGGREHLAGRQAEGLVVPRLQGLAAIGDPFARGVDDLLALRGRMHEAHGFRGGRADLVALQHHLQGIARGHEARDALRAAGSREQPDLDLRQADARLVVIGRDPEMAGERELEGAPEAGAVDRGGEGLAASLEPPVEQGEPPRLLEEIGGRFLLAFALAQLRIFLAEGFEHREVRSAREAVLARGDDAALDGRVRSDLVDDLAELLSGLRS